MITDWRWVDVRHSVPSSNTSHMSPVSSPRFVRDHGQMVAGAWRARSEAAPSATAARPRPARTRDITAFGGTDRANRPPKRPKVVISRHDHGSGAGAWQNKSESPDPADQGRRLVVEWTAGL